MNIVKRVSLNLILLVGLQSLHAENSKAKEKAPPKEEIVEISSGSCQYNNDAKTLTFIKNVKIKYLPHDLTLETEKIIVTRSDNSIKIPHTVTVHSDSRTIQADSAVYSKDTGFLTLKGNVIIKEEAHNGLLKTDLVKINVRTQEIKLDKTSIKFNLK